MNAEVAVPIYDGQDFYVPHFEVKIAGQPQGQGVIRDILAVTYKDSLTDIDSFEIQINNWDADKRRLKYSDSSLFDPGKKFELWMGYYGRDKLRLMVTGEITSLKPSFPASGPPALSVSGLNVLHRLRTKQQSVAYENKKDSQIARQICQRLQVDLDAPNEADETQYDYLFQNNQYDIVYLMERARRIGYDLFVVEQGTNGSSAPAKLFFGRSVQVRNRTYKLTYGKSLIDFAPELTTVGQVSEVTVIGWDRLNKKEIKGTATRSKLRTRGVGDAGGQQAIEQSFSQRHEVIADKPVESQAEADQLALETLEQIAKDLVKGTGSTVGLPDLRAGAVIEIDGLGSRFTGRYFVVSTTHSIGDSGYTTQFECRREEI
jgi:phage protein D